MDAPLSTSYSRRTFVRAILLGGLLPWLPGVAFAQSEFDVKAAYLNNFARMVTWPSSAFPDSKSPFVIAVVGRDPFGGLGDRLRGQSVRGRTIEVRAISANDHDALRACQMIYVGSSANPGAVSAAVQNRPVLVIGDGSGTARDGAMIGFTIKQQKVKLEINNEAAVRARLKIPSDILEMATIVTQP